MTSIKPWQVVDTDIVYKGRRTIENRTYTTPDNARQVFELVIGPDAVGIMPVTEDGMVILVKQFRAGINSETLEFPGGQVDEGESPMEAATRELAEETGYAGDLTYFGPHWNCPYNNNYRHLFLARNCKRVQEQMLDVGEFVEVVMMPIEDVCQLKFTNSLSDLIIAYKGLTELGLVTVHTNVLRGLAK